MRPNLWAMWKGGKRERERVIGHDTNYKCFILGPFPFNMNFKKKNSLCGWPEREMLSRNLIYSKNKLKNIQDKMKFLKKNAIYSIKSLFFMHQLYISQVGLPFLSWIEWFFFWVLWRYPHTNLIIETGGRFRMVKVESW